MAEKDKTADCDAHQLNQEKLDETEDSHGANKLQETVENDSEDTDTNGVSEDQKVRTSTTQPEIPQDGICTDPEVSENNSHLLEKDSGDGQNTETQEEPSTNMHSGDWSVDKAVEPDGPPVISNEKSGDMPPKNNINDETETKDNEDSLESPSENTEAPTPQPDTTVQQNIKEIENIGSISQEKETPSPDVSSVKEDKRIYWIAIAMVALIAILYQLIQFESPPQKTDVHQIDIFHQEMEKLKVNFPSQRDDLWKRSKIHLQRHFQITHPTEPISLILTAGVRAEGTLRCLAQSIASALSSALNVSAIHIEGASKAIQDSDVVKSDIDSQLQKAFEGDKPIAIIHHFEDLPPPSTLIFYRYCDHENAAFKKTFLIFTILLGDQEEIPGVVRLNAVEEMVNDHLQKKFLSRGHPTAFDKMDIDKYSGLWSRISHLILPVATEERIIITGQC